MSADWGSAGAISAPPQLKGFKKATEDSRTEQEKAEWS